MRKGDEKKIIDSSDGGRQVEEGIGRDHVSTIITTRCHDKS